MDFTSERVLAAQNSLFILKKEAVLNDVRLLKNLSKIEKESVASLIYRLQPVSDYSLALQQKLSLIQPQVELLHLMDENLKKNEIKALRLQELANYLLNKVENI